MFLLGKKKSRKQKKRKKEKGKRKKQIEEIVGTMSSVARDKL